MRWIGDLAFRLRALFAPSAMERELDDEMRFHLDMETEKLVARGMTPDEAQRAALRSFGNVTRQKDQARAAWGLNLVSDTRADVRLALRQLKRSPGFAAAAIVTLALGLGANAAIFGVARGALLQSPEVVEPDRLAAVYTTCRRGFPKCSSSWPDLVDYRTRSRTLADLAAYSTVPLNVGEPGSARLASGLLVTGNYFGLLGARVQLGRPILPEDDRLRSPEQVVVLSHELWRDVYASDPAVIGRTVRLNEAPYVVVGVATEGFRGLNLSVRPDVFLPIHSGPALGPAIGAASRESVREARGARWVGTAIGRLVDGATVAQVRDEMDGIAFQLGEQYPDDRAAMDGMRGITVDALPGYILPVGDEATLRRFVFMLIGVVVFSLLMASANLANLLLARATSRGKEIGVRLAIGAGRARLVRQLLTESLVLSALGCIAGVLVAHVMLGLISAFELPGGVVIGDLGVGIDQTVLLFAGVLSVLTALAFGLAPALQATRLNLVHSIKGEWSGRRGGDSHLRRALVALQVGLCLILLVGSGLFIRTLNNSLRTDLGFEPEGVAAARFNLSLLRYSEDEAVAFVDEALRQVRAIGGVQSASMGSLVPFQAGGFRGTFADVHGYELAPDEEVRVDFILTRPGYFETLGLPVIAGRALGVGDVEDSKPVAVINRYMAERYWPGGEAVGGVFTVWDEFDVEVVGVAENALWQTVGEEPTPFVFFSLPQAPSFSTDFLTLIARTDGDAAAMLPAIRERIAAVEPNLSLTFAGTMDDMVARVLMPQRMGMALLSMFGALALILAAVGIYGVVSYSVRRQARDIGIRIAIGANSGEILRGVVLGMVTPVVAGLLIGAVAALGLARTLESFMFEVRPGDPLTFAAIGILLGAVSLVATLVPARWASRLDPMKVLRVE